jgi:hypothetical protein
MNGFSIGTICRDNSDTLVIASDSSVFDFGKLLAASGADSCRRDLACPRCWTTGQHGYLALANLSLRAPLPRLISSG